MPGLTDKIEQTQPAYAAYWYLKIESAVNSVLRMGTRNQSLEYVAFNDNTIYAIASKLPWKLESQAYEFNSKDVYGKVKLTKVLDLIKRARSVAHSRATFTYDQGFPDNLLKTVITESPHFIGDFTL